MLQPCNPNTPISSNADHRAGVGEMAVERRERKSTAGRGVVGRAVAELRSATRLVWRGRKVALRLCPEKHPGYVRQFRALGP